MSDRDNQQTIKKHLTLNETQLSDRSKSIFEDNNFSKQKQYFEDARDYQNLYLKKDSFTDNIVEDSVLNLNKQDSNTPIQTPSLKQLNLVKAFSRQSNKRDSKLTDKTPKTKTSLRYIKTNNGSTVLDRDMDFNNQSRMIYDNNESSYKQITPSAFDTSFQPRDQKYKASLEQTQQNLTVLCVEGDYVREEQKQNVKDNQENFEQETTENINKHLKSQVQDQKKAPQKENKLKNILSNFNKLNMIKKFVKRMTGLSPQFNFRRLKDFHFEVIGDVIQIISSQFLKSKKGKSSFILKPNELFSLIWEIIQIIFLFFHVIAFGFRFGFGILLNDYVQLFSIIFFLLDLIVIMNTGYYSGIEIITDRLKIIKYNIFNIFMIFVTLIALVFSDQGPVQFVFMFRLRQLYRSYNHFESNFQIKQKHPVGATLVRLFLIIILLAHYNACGFYFFTKNFNSDEQNWLNFYGIQDTPWENQYITTLYFSFITMVTVGYGDVVPKTMNERIYIIFFVLISAITFAYVVNTIGSLFQELSRLEGKYNQKKFEIMNYMEERNISKSIQISVLKFLEYTIRQEKELQYSLAGENFLQSIPLKLRQQVYQEYYGRILQEIKLFSMNFSKDFLKQLSVLMKEKTFGPGEELFKQGDKNNTFFFINKGQIEFDIELQGKNIVSLGLLKKGDSFNHKGLFTDYIHEVTARCKQITQIIYLNQDDFQRILKQNKDEYEKYCMMKDKFFQDCFSLGEKCLSCSEFNHSVLSCNLIKYSPCRSNLIAKDQYCVSNIQRTPNQRKIRTQKYNCLLNNPDVKQTLRLFRLEYTYMLMGQKLGSFTELAERNFTDEQFYKFFPQLQYNSENLIHINSVDELNKSDYEECDSGTTNVYKPQQVSPNLRRESLAPEAFLLKFGKDPISNQTHSQSNYQQSTPKIDDPNTESNQQTSKKQIQKKVDQTQSQSEEDEEEESSDEQPSKQESQKQEQSLKQEFQRKLSIKVPKENPTPNQQKPGVQNTRKSSIFQINANMFSNQQQQQNNQSYHTISNYNQYQSNQDLNSVNQQMTAIENQNNQILNQMIQQIQQLIQHNTQNVISMNGSRGGGSRGSGSGGASHINQYKIRGQNVRSLTHIHRDHNNLNGNPAAFHNQSFVRLPTQAATPSGQEGGGERNKFFYLYFDFDLMKEYKYYYPSMNFSQVILSYIQYKENKARKVRPGAASIYRRK